MTDLMASQQEVNLVGLNEQAISFMEQEDKIGCFAQSHETFLVNANGVIVQQISQWFILIVLVITTIVFIFAGLQAHRTHGPCAFDTIVLYLCAIYNIIFIIEKLIYCHAALVFIKNLFVTVMILYLLYNFKENFESLEQELDIIKKRRPSRAVFVANFSSLINNNRSTIDRRRSSRSNRSLRRGSFNQSQNTLLSRRTTLQKLRSPLFFISVVAVLGVLIDAMCYVFFNKSLFKQQHWLALRFIDLVLSIIVFVQGRRIGKLLEEKDQLFLDLGYAEGRLSSPFLRTRKKQLKLISCTYLAANLLVIVEIILTFFFHHRSVQNCAILCAKPYTNAAASLLWAISIIYLVPTHFFIYSFYIIPRRFNATMAERMSLTEGS